ncbi:hypothetical protein JG688_00010434 [Phytophthora aleatoria]|uniref:Uncharacterized protein n=1 Tax=Phytophthora aleatoria TaxID=2496075 RepID=A0A8J5IQB0_9STRA|nr:hypothetical protein JG688_00010434 [Phytophthora aleatoria]
MTTQATSEVASAPNSPSSRAGTAPSDSAAPASRVDIVAAGDHAASRGAAGAALAEDRKGKKKATKRASTSNAASTDRKKPEEGENDASKKAATSTEAAAAVELPGPTYPDSTSSCRQGFDLTSSMQPFEPGRAAVSASAPTAEPHVEEEARAVPTAVPLDPEVGVMAELRTLRKEVDRLRLLHRQYGNHWDGATQSIVTTPTSKGELPPPDGCFLTCASFPEGSKKPKGDYSPPQAHLYSASRMSRDFGTGTGLMAVFSRRLGSRGRTVMHFKESNEMTCLEDGPTSVNFSSDFSPSAGLPTVGVDCGSCDGISTD